MKCRKFIVAVVNKIVERSPLKQTLVKGISSLDPELIFKKPKVAQERMKSLLNILVNKHRIKEEVAEKASQQFALFCKCSKSKGELLSVFEHFLHNEGSDERLDTFYANAMQSCKFKEIFEVTKLVLTLSHGNATVESGFSINKGMLIENLHEESLKALRQVNDGIAAIGGLNEVSVDKTMLRFAKGARSKYAMALQVHVEEEKKEEERKENRKRKLRELKELRSKKLKLSAAHSLESNELNTCIKKLELELQGDIK